VLLQKAEDALRAAATPRGVWKQLPLTALPLQNAHSGSHRIHHSGQGNIRQLQAAH